ncbi:MAG: Gfo/Idh/MocA family oxidoreductase [Proteobacteria bacterium]|nr:Gfo/Idh/MocA family oxidoreductase [Pseudomonadota bacterium]
MKHLPAIAALAPRARAVAVVDIDREQAGTLAGRFQIQGVYTDLEEMLSKERPDVVDICTPPKTHAPIAVQCIQAGAHVLLEKPMCQTETECDQVMAAAKEHRRKVCIAHSDLFYPSFYKARKMLERGDIGKFRGMRIHLSTPVTYITSKPDHWAHKLPGGVFGESGPHVVYLTLPFINPIREVQIIGRKVLEEHPWSSYEDYRLNLIGDEATSSVSMIYDTKQWSGQIDLWGEDGTLRVDMESQALIHTRREELKLIPVGLSSLGEAAQILMSGLGTGFEMMTRRYTQTHQALLGAFVDAIVGDTESPVPGEQGKETIRVMNMITQQL